MAKADSVGKVYIEVKPDFTSLIDVVAGIAEHYQKMADTAQEFVDWLEERSGRP